MPENVLKKLNSKILPQWKVCFIFALICGMLAHFYKITNWLPNWDGLVFRYDAQNMIALGRWFLPVVTAPSSFYDLPFVCGLIAIFLHAVSAVFICKMLDIKGKITASLIGGVLITFPALTSVMMYSYIADGYAVAFLFSTLAAVFMTNKKPNYLLSVIFIALSAGIYQAYITVTVMLLLLYLIKEIIFDNKNAVHTIKNALKFLLCGAVGMVLYYVILNVLLKISGTQLLDYQGMNNALSASAINIPASVYVCVKSFKTYFFDFSVGFNTFSVLNVIIFAVTLILFVALLISRKISLPKILLVLLFTALLPFGAGVLAFINCFVDYHNLMKMGYVVFYMFLIILYEKNIFKCPKDTVFVKWSILLLVCAIIFNHIIIANVSYHKLQIAYEKSYGTLIRIADRIEQTEGADKCSKILVIGELDGAESYSSILPPDMTGTTDGFILRADDESVKQSIMCSALNDYCGKNYTFISGTEKDSIIKDKTIVNMDIWPHKNSVSVLGDTVVIKLSQEESK